MTTHSDLVRPCPIGGHACGCGGLEYLPGHPLAHTGGPLRLELGTITHAVDHDHDVALVEAHAAAGYFLGSATDDGARPAAVDPEWTGGDRDAQQLAIAGDELGLVATFDAAVDAGNCPRALGILSGSMVRGDRTVARRYQARYEAMGGPISRLLEVEAALG